MSALTSLLVRDQVVQVRKIEEALQRQVMRGGDIETVLLEMDAVPEDVLAAYRGALFGLLPATRAEVMGAPRDTVRLVPREVAERHRLVPLAAEGRKLVIAVTAPLQAETEERLVFLLGYDIAPRIANEARIAIALQHHYGVELEPRIARLAEQLRARDPGVVPYVAPPTPSKIDSLAPALPRKSSGLLGVLDEDSGSGTFEALDDAPPRRDTEPPTPALDAPPPVAEADSAEPAPASPAPRADTVPSPPSSASLDASALRVPPSRAPSTLAKRVRGPLLPRQAAELLAEASTRDEVLAVFTGFARQFFEYCALFVVSGDIAEGRDAYGPGASFEEVQRIAVPLDVPGAFADVRRIGEPCVVNLGFAELDRIVSRDLRRDQMQPAMLYPVRIRDRVVLILYGDRDGESFVVEDVPELLAFGARISQAFERLIRRRKLPSGGYATHKGRGSGSLKAAASEMIPLRPRVEPVESAGYASGGRGASPAAAVDDNAKTLPGTRLAPVAGEAVAPSRAPRFAATVVGVPVAARSDALSVLGVPRSAPPPPMPRAAPAPDDDLAGLGDVPEPTLRDTERPPAMDDDYPDVQVELGDPDDEIDLRSTLAEGRGAVGLAPARTPGQGAPRPDGAYTVRDVTEEVFPKRRRPSSVPPEESHRRPSSVPPDEPPVGRPSRSRRPDPRREGGGDVTSDVVSVPAGRPARSEPPSGSEPARRRQSIPTPASGEEPKVIVDMGESVDAIVDDVLRSAPDDDHGGIDSLVRLGEAALPAIVQNFPGPLWFDRHQPHKRLPRGRDVSAMARALVAFRDRAAPYVSSMLDVNDSDLRFYATLVASEIPHPSLVEPLGRRVFDEDAGTRTLALDVLRLFRHFPEFSEVLDAVRTEARVPGRDPVPRRLGARALGELRDTQSLDLLVALLEEEDPQLREAAAHALVVLTRQDFADSHRRWSAWAAKNGGRHRVEWLIDALTHDDEELRAEAGDELKRITQEYFGFHPAATKRERERVQKKYEQWWQSEGHKRFVH